MSNEFELSIQNTLEETTLPKDEHALVSTAIQDSLTYWVHAYAERYKRVADCCDSPIERKLLMAYISTCDLLEVVAPKHTYREVFLFGDGYTINDQQLSNCGWVERLEIQKEIGKYRADFLCTILSNGTPVHQYIIECDGHDFHERTKQQAARDRSRDRWFQSQGFDVYRFTGSEIHKDVFKCANELRSVEFKLRMKRFSRSAP